MAGKVTHKGELMFPSDYLSAVEFKGGDVTLTVKDVFADDLRTKDGGKERKWVISFIGTDKKLVLNKTNSEAIAHLHGSKAENWIGERVTFYPTRVSAFGAMTDAIRVRETKPSEPQQQEQQQQPTFSDADLDAGLLGGEGGA